MRGSSSASRKWGKNDPRFGSAWQPSCAQRRRMHRADNTTMDANSAKPYSTKRFIRRSIAIGSWLVLACVLSAWILLQFGDDWWLGTLVMFLPRWPWVVLPIFSIVSSAALRRRSLLPALIS